MIKLYIVLMKRRKSIVLYIIIIIIFSGPVLKDSLANSLKFIDEKNSPLLPIKPLAPAPSIETESLVPDPLLTRESVECNAKADAIVPGHFAGISTDNSGGTN